MVNSLKYATTIPAQTDKRSTDKIKHDMILKKDKKKKENKDVALPLACIIFTVKTMILTCKEEYSFFVQNKIQTTTNVLCCLCQRVYDQLFFPVICMSSHIFAKKKFSKSFNNHSIHSALELVVDCRSFCVHFIVLFIVDKFCICK